MPDELAVVKEKLPFLIPLVLLQFMLMIIAIIDLVKGNTSPAQPKLSGCWLSFLLTCSGQ